MARDSPSFQWRSICAWKVEWGIELWSWRKEKMWPHWDELQDYKVIQRFVWPWIAAMVGRKVSFIGDNSLIEALKEALREVTKISR